MNRACSTSILDASCLVWVHPAWCGCILPGVGASCLVWVHPAWCGCILPGVGASCLVWVHTARCGCGCILPGVGASCLVWVHPAWCGCILPGVGASCLVWVHTAWCGCILPGVGASCLVWVHPAWCGCILPDSVKSMSAKTQTKIVESVPVSQDPPLPPPCWLVRRITRPWLVQDGQWWFPSCCQLLSSHPLPPHISFSLPLPRNCYAEMTVCPKCSRTRSHRKSTG